MAHKVPVSAQLQQTLAILPRKDLDTVSMIPVNHPIYDVGQTLTFAFFSQFDGLAIFLNTPDLFKSRYCLLFGTAGFADVMTSNPDLSV